jgi:hypothetical protein
MISFNERIERLRFADYIFQTWDSSKHNFNINENGDYVYQTLQMAWEAWSFAKQECLEHVIKDEEKRSVSKLKAVKNG